MNLPFKKRKTNLEKMKKLGICLVLENYYEYYIKE